MSFRFKFSIDLQLFIKTKEEDIYKISSSFVKYLSIS